MISTPSTRPSIWPETALAASLADFLRRCPNELAKGPVEPSPAGWFDANRATELSAVHRSMLETAYHSDKQRYGQLDYWAVDVAGDCEDKALWCHRRLFALGWPKSAMRLWLCLARLGGRWRGHAVLVVSLTLSGGAVVDVALDCLRATPTRQADLGYRLWRIVDPGTLNRADTIPAEPDGRSMAETTVGAGAAGQD